MKTEPVKLKFARLALAGLYAAGAVFNLTFTRSNPSILLGWADTSLIPLQADLIRTLIAPNGAAFAVAVAAYELVTAGLLAAGPASARAGHVLAAAFNVVAAPLWIVQVPLNGGLAVIHVLLYRAASSAVGQAPARRGPRPGSGGGKIRSL